MQLGGKVFILHQLFVRDFLNKWHKKQMGLIDKAGSLVDKP